MKRSLHGEDEDAILLLKDIVSQEANVQLKDPSHLTASCPKNFRTESLSRITADQSKARHNMDQNYGPSKGT